jgi:L-alanine-DL-glutamate epimerase-like enolase superfamily enzyme
MTEASNQIIRKVSVHVVKRDVEPMGAHGATAGARASHYMGVLRVFDGEGREGNAFIGAPHSESDRAIAPAGGPLKDYLLGKRVGDREAIWHELRGLAATWEIPDAALMAADVALWDLAAKGAGVPLYELFGAYRHKTPAYGSAPFFETAEQNVEAALKRKAEGLRGWKLHHVVPDRRGIVKVCRAVREAMGPEFPLMYDGLRDFDLRDALYVGGALDELRYDWFEDPMTVHDLPALAELGRRLATPIAVSDEPNFKLADAPRVIAAGAARILRGEPAKDGLTGMRKMAALCEAHGLMFEPHVGFNPLLDFAVLHVALSIRNCAYFPLDVVSPRDRYVGLVENPAIDAEGFVHGPKAPGLGAEIDWKFIEAHTAAVL